MLNTDSSPRLTQLLEEIGESADAWLACADGWYSTTPGPVDPTEQYLVVLG
ncbi:hypothetical protein [Allokutzneria albata]|uniref:Uncharacterized protein n=1 Tax=Allokutzneria albata TaxID=211114 RepID=A0A1H0DSV4_ALLAB|nr:hypothetical protein [Allokutzneria albata]SDN73158.1 hypothetical protein SAMN04489726_7973 [Allokutzneria albata]